MQNLEAGFLNILYFHVGFEHQKHLNLKHLIFLQAGNLTTLYFHVSFEDQKYLNIKHLIFLQAGGGNVKIESRKLEWNAQPRTKMVNENYTGPTGGDKKVYLYSYFYFYFYLFLYFCLSYIIRQWESQWANWGRQKTWIGLKLDQNEEWVYN